MTTVCVAFLGTGNAGKSAMFKHLLWLDDPDAAWNDVDGAKKEFVWHLCSLVASFQNETNPGAFQSVPAEDIQMLTEAGVAAHVAELFMGHGIVDVARAIWDDPGKAEDGL